LTLIIVLAVIIGFISSAPLGPLGAYMIRRMEKNGFWDAFPLGLFSALIDTIYCSVSLFGMSLVLEVPILRFIIEVVSLIVLLYVGKKYFFLQGEKLEESDTEKLDNNNGKDSFQPNGGANRLMSHLKDASVVFIFAFSNPTLLAFWINMANLLHSSVLRNYGSMEYLAFSVGVGLGSALCQYTVLQIIQKVHRFNDTGRVVIVWLSSLIFVITIIYFGIQVVNDFITKII